MSGFTILEVMIATAILTLGLAGILALFPVAIHYGKQVVERSSASVIAESVAEAIRHGLRNNLRSVKQSGGGGETYHYFIFNHDGVQDPIPSRKELEKPEKGYYILLPRFKSGSEGVFSNPDAAQQVAKTFVYPESDNPPNGGGNSFVSDDDGDDYSRKLTQGGTVREVFVDKTYRLGSTLPPEDGSAAGEDVLEDQKIETLKQYSYAFEIQSSTADANLSFLGQPFKPANRLYRVRVMIFRGFPRTEGNRPAVLQEPVLPVFELDFEVSI